MKRKSITCATRNSLAFAKIRTRRRSSRSIGILPIRLHGADKEITRHVELAQRTRLIFPLTSVGN